MVHYYNISLYFLYMFSLCGELECIWYGNMSALIYYMQTCIHVYTSCSYHIIVDINHFFGAVYLSV